MSMHELSQICHEPAQTRLYYYSIVLFYKIHFMPPRNISTVNDIPRKLGSFISSISRLGVRESHPVQPGLPT